MAQITVKEMLAEMELGQVFSLTYVTFDMRRRKGGKLHTLYEARLLGASDEERAAKAGRSSTKLEDDLERTALIKAGRDPRHMKWYTRNLRVMQDGLPTSLILKIHPPLVITYNNMIVVA
jgi:hypothetical protein